VGIDLHIHSTASDGTLTPAELLARARNLGLQAISITDHDCVDGSREALSLGVPPELGFVTGVEISASPPPFLDAPGSFHILGYAIDPDHPGLSAALARLQNARRNRNPKILERLRRLGIDIALEAVREVAGQGQMGRPHIARVMVEGGFAASIDEAFDRYLGTGQPAYVGKERIACRDAIEMIRRAGGVAVLAHPGLLNPLSQERLENLLIRLVDMGIGGIEAFYPAHSPGDTACFLALAERHKLIITGGTDFHGDIKPDIEMGIGSGDFDVPNEYFQLLIQRAETAGRGVS
jgi:predicted metal-dependent phosphoesterase TrpH